MQDFETLNKLNDKICLIVGQPDDLMRAMMLILASNGCEVNLGIDYSNEKEVFLANSILNESWTMGKKGKIINIHAKEQKSIKQNSNLILNEINSLDILIMI
ncbi:MAG: hypothetical protein P8J51_04200 [Dehalococcoidia bacterium]|jgi:hypothetical protein|nr:hypothetical protein [Dehalococcoidia bacterium]